MGRPLFGKRQRIKYNISIGILGIGENMKMKKELFIFPVLLHASFRFQNAAKRRWLAKSMQAKAQEK